MKDEEIPTVPNESPWEILQHWPRTIHCSMCYKCPRTKLVSMYAILHLLVVIFKILDIFLLLKRISLIFCYRHPLMPLILTAEKVIAFRLRVKSLEFRFQNGDVFSFPLVVLASWNPCLGRNNLNKKDYTLTIPKSPRYCFSTRLTYSLKFWNSFMVGLKVGHYPISSLYIVISNNKSICFESTSNKYK